MSKKIQKENIIEIKNLYKTFNLGEISVEVLKGINLNIEKGEFVSIMGPSGSGKSTLLYLIGGLDTPTSGKLLVNGKEMSELKDDEQSIIRRREIGFIFQFYNLIPNLNVEENVLLPIFFDGKRVKDYMNKVDELLDLVGLTKRKKHTPRELSGGEQQRVAIARALINEPEIILGDEVTGNLDSKTGTEIMKLLKKISEEKEKTIFQVTHSKEASLYSNRIVHLKDGRIR